MKKGAYVLIFFFWAFLTIITPTLVQWSAEAAAASSHSDKGKSGLGSSTSTIEEFNEEPISRARKMMELFEDPHRRKSPSLPPPLLPPAPAPVEDERVKKEEVNLKEEGLIISRQVFSSRRLLQYWKWARVVKKITHAEDRL